MNIDQQTYDALLRFQRNEITESIVYTKLAVIEKDPDNRDVLLRISADKIITNQFDSLHSSCFQVIS